MDLGCQDVRGSTGWAWLSYGATKKEKSVLRGSVVTSVVIDQCFLAILYIHSHMHTHIHAHRYAHTYIYTHIYTHTHMHT